MVNDQTQQFLYRSVIISMCLITGSIFIFLYMMAWRFGDGEAVAITNAVQPLAITVLSAMVTTALGSHVASAYVARQMAQVHIAQLQTAPAPAAASEPAETLAGVTPHG